MSATALPVPQNPEGVVQLDAVEVVVSWPGDAFAAHPLVEDDERPERLRVIAASLGVHASPRLESATIEQPGVPERRWFEGAPAPLAHRTPQPGAKRDAEALLGSANDVVGQVPGRGELEHVLRLAAAQLQ